MSFIQFLLLHCTQLHSLNSFQNQISYGTLNQRISKRNLTMYTLTIFPKMNCWVEWTLGVQWNNHGRKRKPNYESKRINKFILAPAPAWNKITFQFEIHFLSCGCMKLLHYWNQIIINSEKKWLAAAGSLHSTFFTCFPKLKWTPASLHK